MQSNISVVSLFTLFLFFHGGSCDLDYSYEGCKGPRYWPELYPDCGDPYQSPIVIVPYSSVSNSNGSVVVLVNEDYPEENSDAAMFKYNISNNGHTAVIRLLVDNDIYVPTLYNTEFLDGNYKLDYIQLHWGPNDSVGSEHTVLSRRFPMELQAVFKPDEKSKGTVVLAALFKHSEYDNPGLAGLASTVHLVEEAGSSAVSADYVNLHHLIPVFTCSYMLYKGSMTSPPCEGDVTWIVDYESLTASGREVVPFRRLKDKTGQPITANYRPLQDPRDRKQFITNYC